jgi:N,N'-diacetylchitobiose transport system substrate-binding protein
VKNAQLDGKQYGVPWYAGVRDTTAPTGSPRPVSPPTTWDG